MGTQSLLASKLGFLSTRVARRIFLLFIVCALVPLVALGFFCHRQVVSQLEADAEERLRYASRSAAMTIFERILFARAEHRVIVNALCRQAVPDLERASAGFSEEDPRIGDLTLMTSSGEPIQSIGAPLSGIKWTSAQRQHLHAGKTAVFASARGRGHPQLYICRSLAPEDAEGPILCARIRRDYIWDEDTLASPHSSLAVFTDDGLQLLSSDASSVPADTLMTEWETLKPSGRLTWKHEGVDCMGGYSRVYSRPTLSTSFVVIQGQFLSDVMLPVVRFESTFFKVLLLTLSIVTLLSYKQIRKSTTPITVFNAATKKIAEGDLTTRVLIDSGDEYQRLGESFNRMVEGLEENVRIVNTFNEIGVSVSAEGSSQKLLRTIVQRASEIVSADACAIYLVDEAAGTLRLKALRILSRNLLVEESAQEPIPLRDEEGQSNQTVVAAFCAVEEKVVTVADVYDVEGFVFSGNWRLDQTLGYRTSSLLAVPMKDHKGDVIGVLQMANAGSAEQERSRSFTDEERVLAETLALNAALALTKNQLVDDFRSLFEALTECLARAIDGKSKYTGDHCRRVPILTMMIADAIQHARTGPLADFEFSEDEMYELKVAALLHDAGKVVTPVHVVDKATKLETIYDRIDLVRTRFELVKREKERDWWRIRALANDELDAEEPESDPRFAEEVTRIQADMEFVRESNIGGERMAPEDQQRIRNIARRYPLDSDLDGVDTVLTDEEVKNLVISRGTLNDEEREIINNHVVATINMLEALPYPKNLRNVPRYAGAHHERMDGSGYPFGRAGEQIPIQGRIIGISDVFEALTAKDRPYKQGKTLSEALRILGFMKKDGYIDASLFDIFVKEKIYRRYAEEHLDAEQIDDVVEADIPGYTPAEAEDRALVGRTSPSPLP